MNKYIILISTLLVIFSTAIAQNNQDSLARPLLVPGAPLKEMKLGKLDSTVWTNAEIPANKNVMLIILNLTCGHCRQQTKDIMDSLSKFDDTYIIIATGGIMRDYYKDYCEATGFKPAKNLILLYDDAQQTKDIFAYKAVPQIMLYNKERKLLTTFYKEQSVHTLRMSFDYPAFSIPKPKRKLFGRRR